ncbi:MAG: hypothetical protein M3N24_03015 [Actinomycetota bacterium]|nr:hypothetical protein [Actinomycetota bacterium]
MDQTRRAVDPKLGPRRAAVVAAVAVILSVVLLVLLNRRSDFAGQWYDRNDRPVPNGDEGEGLVLDVDTGDGHCDWENVVFMDLAWPVGSVIRGGPNRPNVRQYIRNPGPGHVPQQGLPETYVADASLPTDAFDTGFHRGGWHLWISPSQADRYIYVVSEDRTERWTRSRGYTICA